MNTDIRIAITCTDHPKTKKLIRRLGYESFWCLVKFWSFVAVNKPDGDISCYDSEDIEIGSGWDNEEGVFYNALVDLGFVDERENNKTVHDWEKHNGWACGAEKRSEHARTAAKARWDKRITHGGTTELMPEQCGEHTNSNAPSPNPSPNPSPKPKRTNGKFNPVLFRPEWVSEDLWQELLENRKYKKLQNSKLALTTITNSIKKAVDCGYCVEECIGQFVTSGWKRFDVDWMKKKNTETQNYMAGIK